MARTPHFALHRCALEGSAHPGETSGAPLFAPPATWLGAMVPKRWARRAVTRNAIKRQIYSVSARYEAGLPQAAYVVRLRSGFDRQAFPSATSVALKCAVRAELEQLFERQTGRQSGRQGAAP